MNKDVASRFQNRVFLKRYQLINPSSFIFFSEKYWLMTSKLARMIMKRPAMVRVILRNKSASAKENQSCKIKSNTQLTNNPRQA